METIATHSATVQSESMNPDTGYEADIDGTLLHTWGLRPDEMVPSFNER